MPHSIVHRCLAVALLAAAGCSTSGASPNAAPTTPQASPDRAPVTVQPGAPGERTRAIEGRDLDVTSLPAVTEADVRFMQGMIPHHQQALIMTDHVQRNSRDDGIRQMALRMEISQRDEIAVMESWLQTRGHTTASGEHAGHGGMMHMMPGMLAPEQLDALASARGTEFDRLFLELMIQHHEGAIVMVEELFSTPGGGQASEVFQLASHIDADQRMEIDRMRSMLDALR
jgi:uncharacterized protein (DUF305 family)